MCVFVVCVCACVCVRCRVELSRAELPLCYTSLAYVTNVWNGKKKKDISRIYIQVARVPRFIQRTCKMKTLADEDGGGGRMEDVGKGSI